MVELQKKGSQKGSKVAAKPVASETEAPVAKPVQKTEEQSEEAESMEVADVSVSQEEEAAEDVESAAEESGESAAEDAEDKSDDEAVAAEKSDGSDEEASDSEAEDEKPEVTPAKKRKSEEGDAEPAPKKQKDEETTCTIMITELPEDMDDAKFNTFLLSKDLKCIACRANYAKQKAFVDINIEDKEKAMALDGCEFEGATLSVGIDLPRGKRNADWAPGKEKDPNRDERTLFVKNLPYSADEASIINLFEGVKEVRLLTDRDSKRPKGMGFIEFTDKAQKEAIFAKKEDYEMEGRQLYLDTLDGNNRGGGRGGARGGARGGRGASRGAGPRGSVPSKTLYVKGVTENITKEHLSNAFPGANQIRLITDRDTGANKGFCYIEYDNESAATDVYKTSKGGFTVEDAHVFVDYAQDKSAMGGRGGFGGRGGGRGRGGRGRGRGRGGRGNSRGRGGAR